MPLFLSYQCRPPGPGYALPRNVHLIDLGQDGIAKLFSAVAEEPHYQQILSTTLTEILQEMPWMIIQFKVSSSTNR